jgi:hypothetical protein
VDHAIGTRISAHHVVTTGDGRPQKPGPGGVRSAVDFHVGAILSSAKDLEGWKPARPRRPAVARIPADRPCRHTGTPCTLPLDHLPDREILRRCAPQDDVDMEAD